MHCALFLSQSKGLPLTRSLTVEARSGSLIHQNLHQSPFCSTPARNQRILRYRSVVETKSPTLFVQRTHRLHHRRRKTSWQALCSLRTEGYLSNSLFFLDRSSQTTKARPCFATFQASMAAAHLELAFFLTRFLYLKISSPLQILNLFSFIFLLKDPSFFSFPWVWYLV